MAKHSDKDDQSRRRAAIKRLKKSDSPVDREMGQRGERALRRTIKNERDRAQREKTDRKNPPRPS